MSTLTPPRMPAVVAPSARLRQAAVVSVQAGPPQSVTMHLAGDTTTDIVGMRHLDSYAPVAGDSVWVLQNDSDYLIIGRLAVAAPLQGISRIATVIRTTDSAAIGTTETVFETVVAAVVVGRIYRVRWSGRINPTAANDDATVAIREDSLTGTSLQGVIVDLPIINRPPRIDLEVEYTADATENKTFVATLIRNAGSGNVVATAAATQPTYFYVDYIRG